MRADARARAPLPADHVPPAFARIPQNASSQTRHAAAPTAGRGAAPQAALDRRCRGDRPDRRRGCLRGLSPAPQRAEHPPRRQAALHRAATTAAAGTGAATIDGGRRTARRPGLAELGLRPRPHALRILARRSVRRSRTSGRARSRPGSSTRRPSIPAVCTWRSTTARSWPCPHAPGTRSGDGRCRRCSQPRRRSAAAISTSRH